MIPIRMRGSRGPAIIAACAVLGALAFSLLGPARSAAQQPHRQRLVNAEVTGPLIIAWSGDPAHGCAAAGLCGVTGSVQLHLGGAEASSSDEPPELIANDEAAVVRVQTTEPDASVATCADLIPTQFDFTVRHAGDDLATGISTGFGAAETPSSGRCAGPTSGEMAALTLPARRVGRGYDFSGHTSFTVGPFAVTVISGVRVRITSGVPDGGDGSGESSGDTVVDGSGTGPPVKTRSALLETAGFTYRVIGFSGTMDTDVAGSTPPQCDALGACGLTGRLVQSFTTRGRLSFLGTRIATRRIGRDGALAALRHGDMAIADTFGEQPIKANVDETNSQTGSLPCTGTSSVVVAGGRVGRVRRNRDELVLSDANDGFGDGPSDAFRTSCPGPSAQDILGPSGTIATATVTAGQLGDKHLSITFRGSRSFHGSAYSGRRRGTVVLGLALVRSTGGTRRVHLFAGEPPTP
jgi:hypothetical protein